MRPPRSPPPRSKIEADYEVPFLAHAPMEPLNCTADVKPDRCAVWASTQGQSAARQIAAQVTGLPPEKVEVHTLYMGGGFGRRAAADYIGEAVEVSKAVGAPVKLTWSREDDLQQDLYRPASYTTFAGALDAEGWPLALTSRIACPPFGGVRNGLSRVGVEGVADVVVRDCRTCWWIITRSKPAFRSATGAAWATRRTRSSPRVSWTRWPRPAARIRWKCGAVCWPNRRACSACSNWRPRNPAGASLLRRDARAACRWSNNIGSFTAQVAEVSVDRRQAQDPSGGLRGGLRPRGQSRDPRTADPERHRVRSGRRA